MGIEPIAANLDGITFIRHAETIEVVFGDVNVPPVFLPFYGADFYTICAEYCKKLVHEGWDE